MPKREASAKIGADEEPAAKKKTGKSPKDEYFEKLESALTAYHGIGSMIIKGISREENFIEDGSQNEDEEEYTPEEMQQIRHIIVTKERQACIKKAMKFASLDQYKDSFAMFNTHSGNVVIEEIPKEVKKAMRKKTLPGKFDSMLALTYALQTYDFWMNDNEEWGEGGGLEKAVILLANTWKKLLRHTDAELGVDADFTRPGTLALLEDFKETIESSDLIEVDFDFL